MKYSNEIEIGVPRERAVALFDNPDNMKHWLDGFVSMTHKSGEYGKPGAVSEIIFKQGKRDMILEEVIESRDMKGEFIAVFTTKGMWNRSEHYLSENSKGTTWLQKNEFRGEGILMKAMLKFFPGMFSKQTAKQMKAFKKFAENA